MDGHADVSGLEPSGPFVCPGSVSVEPLLLRVEICDHPLANAVIGVMHQCDYWHSDEDLLNQDIF